MKKLNPKYWYLTAHLKYDKTLLPYSLSPPLLEVVFRSPLKSMFGEISSSLSLDVLKFDEISDVAIVRVPKENYVKMRAALTFLTSMQIGETNVPLNVSVTSASSCLLSIMGPQREGS